MTPFESSAQTAPTKLIKMKEVIERTTLSKKVIYTRIKNGVFPQQVAIGPRARAFVESEVEAYIQSLMGSRATIPS